MLDCIHCEDHVTDSKRPYYLCITCYLWEESRGNLEGKQVYQKIIK